MTKTIVAITSILLIATASLGQNGKFQSRPIPIIPLQLQTRAAKIPARTATAQQKLNLAAVKFLQAATKEKAPADLHALAQQMAVSPFSGQIPSTASADIEALCFIVLMQATKDMEEDLKQMMDSVQAINKEKENLRNQQAKLKEMAGKAKKDARSNFRPIQTKPAQLKLMPTKHDLAKIPVLRAPSSLPKNVDSMSLGEIQAQIDAFEKEKDSLGDLSEELQTKLQMYTDRRKQAMETLSNMMKKFSDTSSSIIKNLK